MGILGLTHDENGAALEKLPLTTKVAIGEGLDLPAKTAIRAAWIISFSNGNYFGGKMWCGFWPLRSLKHTGKTRPNWESSSSMTTREKCFERSMPCGRRVAVNAEADLYRFRMGVDLGSKCKRLGGRKSTLRERLGLATTSTSMSQGRASRLSSAVTVAPI